MVDYISQLYVYMHRLQLEDEHAYRLVRTTIHLGPLVLFSVDHITRISLTDIDNFHRVKHDL